MAMATSFCCRMVKGAPALNINAAAHLAWAGLTWNDVKKVVVPGWKQSAEAVINGQADACTGTNPVCDDETMTCGPCTGHGDCSSGACVLAY